MRLVDIDNIVGGGTLKTSNDALWQENDDEKILDCSVKKIADVSKESNSIYGEINDRIMKNGSKEFKVVYYKTNKKNFFREMLFKAFPAPDLRCEAAQFQCKSMHSLKNRDGQPFLTKVLALKADILLYRTFFCQHQNDKRISS